ncbi:Bladder cancer-associated protein BC-10 protein [Takifugu flavidus]|uniref:Bladder cancer-associated protein BC-10 protein n=1 Tax=Takifugu flavidus TaxID=433684 RepID=A0A5C6MFK2_9TELE|nr:Bladder cancer-associated protein BC-10 protein [Takifugu flavidus]
MYCLQWLLPVLLIPKPLNPALWFNHSMFMGFYLLSFLLERKPCTICALVFLAALFLLCYSCWATASSTTAKMLPSQTQPTTQ